MRCTIRIVLAVGMLWSTSSPVPAAAQSVTNDTVFNLGSIVPSAINNRGQVAGTRGQFPDPTSAVMWQDGQTTDLAASVAGTSSDAPGINDLGQVLLNVVMADGVWHAFIWEQGRVTALGTLGGSGSRAEAINNNGQAVGRSVTSTGATHLFLWQAGQLMDLGLDESPLFETVTMKINNRAQILLGYSLWQGGSLVNLLPPGVFGAPGFGSTDLNDQGQAVLAATLPSGETHALLWNDGRYTDLGVRLSVGSRGIAPLHINNRGQVVGSSVGGPFQWGNGQVTNLGGGTPRAINNRGQVLVAVPGGTVVWQDGQTLALPSPDGGITDGYAINDQGQAIGRYTTGTFWQPVVRSLFVNGATAYAQVADAPDLNIRSDWTVEAWFRDDDPNGFNHDFRQILMKGDRDANSEAPYFVLVGRNSILAGVRTGGVDYPITWDLVNAGLDPTLWHHVAVSFNSKISVLNLWLDGSHVSYLQVPAHSTVGNTLPLEIGRNGPRTGKYWMGELQDVRVWSIARKGSDITSSYATQLSGLEPGLVANWRFDEGTGLLAADRSGKNHTATLNGGAAFSVEPRGGAGTADGGDPTAARL